MKYFNLLIALAFLSMTFIACDKDEDHDHDHDHDHMGGTEYAYHAHIHSPNTDNKHMGDQLPIDILFESHKGETVHNINVKIVSKDDNTKVIYDKPDDAHVHATAGKFEFEEMLLINEATGFSGHSDWLLIASVWGSGGADDGLVRDTVAFHVHP